LHGQLAQHLRSSQPKELSTHCQGNMGKFEKTTGVGKSGVLEHKSVPVLGLCLWNA